jgi:hypothetical protein
VRGPVPGGGLSDGGEGGERAGLREHPLPMGTPTLNFSIFILKSGLCFRRWTAFPWLSWQLLVRSLLGTSPPPHISLFTPCGLWVSLFCLLAVAAQDYVTSDTFVSIAASLKALMRVTDDVFCRCVLSVSVEWAAFARVAAPLDLSAAAGGSLHLLLISSPQSRIEGQVSHSRERLQALNGRVGLIRDRIAKIGQSSKAVTIFAATKYPATEGVASLPGARAWWSAGQWTAAVPLLCMQCRATPTTCACTTARRSPSWMQPRLRMTL